jgi:alanyl-tRNA synthetase
MGIVEKGSFHLNEKVIAEVDIKKRANTVLNHTATHLLHMVLREVLGTHVTQKGSLVEPERLRFDFSHSASLTPHELKAIEYRVNEEIRRNHESSVHTTTPEKAIQQGAIALFGEKYGDKVRVVQFGDSVELCGGTHAHHTGDIGLFKIISESGVAAGIRRLEAVTGEKALYFIEKRETDYQKKLLQAEERMKTLEKQLMQLKEKLATNMSEDLLSQVKKVSGIPLLVVYLDSFDTKSWRHLVDQLKNKLKSGVIVLATAHQGKASVIAGVTPDYCEKIKASELINMIASQIGGKGGGRSDLAEAGGNQPEHLKQALASIDSWIEKIK